MYRRLCIVLVLIAISESIFALDESALATCKETSHVSEELLNTLVSSKFNPEMDDPNGQCFVACMLEQMGILRSDGTVDSKVVLDVHGIGKIDGPTDEIEKCSDQPGEGCKKKYNIAGCLERALRDIMQKRVNYMGK